MSEPLKSALPYALRRKKVWSSEDQIEAAIDRAKRKLLKQQQIVEEEKDKIRQLGLDIMTIEELKGKNWQEKVYPKQLAIGGCKEKISKAEKSWRRIEDKTLPKLKNALAAMRTETMPAVMGSYIGVQPET
jgi:hypothetical protein